MKTTTLKPIGIEHNYRRNLPHFEFAGSVYFLTFKTAQGLILSEAAKDVVLKSLLFHDAKKYQLYSCVIMNTHAHAIIQPLASSSVDGATFNLAQIMHSVKSYSAKRINAILNREGSVWLDESYDRVIRDEIELLEKLNYIAGNPVKAGLADHSGNYKWLYLKDETLRQDA